MADVELDAQARPFAAYSVQKDSAGLPPRQGGADHRYRLARFTGRGWEDGEIAYAGSRLYAGEDDYTGGVALVPGDSSRRLHLDGRRSRDGGAARQRRATASATTRSSGARRRARAGRFEWTAVTRDSTADNLRPIVPRTERGSELVLWLRGRYRSYTDYDLEVVGLIPKDVSGTK